jgi:hypothetical protein
MPRLLKALAILCCLLASPIASRADGAAGITLDATWWNGLSDGEQGAAVAAALDAFRSGLIETWGYTLASGHVTNSDPTGVFRLMRASFTHTFGYYQSAITDFYVTNPHSKATIGDLIPCLDDKDLESGKSAACLKRWATH